MESPFVAEKAAGTGRLDIGRFSSQHASHLSDALEYLRGSQTFRAVLRRLAASGNVVFLEFHPAHTKYLFHNPNNLRIQWNPFLALQDATGAFSPALLLAHELGHAQFTHAERTNMRLRDRPQGFECEAFGVEEAHVIAAVETPIARELNTLRHVAGLSPLETACRCQHQLGRLVEVAGPLFAAPSEH